MNLKEYLESKKGIEKEAKEILNKLSAEEQKILVDYFNFDKTKEVGNAILNTAFNRKFK